MKFTSLFVAALALAACSPASAPAAHAAGEVVHVSPADGAVTVRHGAIPEYHMGAMTMEFTTENTAQLNGIAVGDHVEFVLKGPTEIDTIKVVKQP